jgi:hypothetical protein
VKPSPDAISTGAPAALDDRAGAGPRWRFPEERVEQLVQAVSRLAGPVIFFAALAGLIWIAIRAF